MRHLDEDTLSGAIALEIELKADMQMLSKPLLLCFDAPESNFRSI
jgi:hypothetical protein